MKNTTFVLAVSFAAGLTSAEAVFTTYTSSTAFLSALPGPSNTETYESYAVNSVILGALGSYTYTGFPTYDSGSPLFTPTGFLTGRIDSTSDVNSGPTDYSGFFSVAGGSKSLAAYFNPLPTGSANKDYFFDGDSFTVGVPLGTRAIGIFFNTSSANTPNANDLFITTSQGSAFNGGTSFDTQFNNAGTQTLFFVGLIADLPFTSATIGVADPGNTGWNVDNLTTATPEPTSAFLLGLGIASVVGYSRKRAQR